MPRQPRIPEPTLATIITRVEARECLTHLATEYAIPITTLSSALARRGVRSRAKRGPRPGTQANRAEQAARILAAAANGELRITVIAGDLRINHLRVRAVLRAAGYPPYARPKKPPAPRTADLTRRRGRHRNHAWIAARILAAYDAGETRLIELATTLKHSKIVVRQVLRDHGRPIRMAGSLTYAAVHARVLAAYAAHRRITPLAAAAETTPQTARKHLRDAGLWPLQQSGRHDPPLEPPPSAPKVRPTTQAKPAAPTPAKPAKKRPLRQGGSLRPPIVTARVPLRTPTQTAPTTITSRSCPECHAAVPTDRYADHRREAHGVGREPWQIRVDTFLRARPTAQEGSGLTKAPQRCPECGMAPCDNPSACGRRQRQREQAARMAQQGGRR